MSQVQLDTTDPDNYCTSYVVQSGVVIKNILRDNDENLDSEDRYSVSSENIIDLDGNDDLLENIVQNAIQHESTEA